MSINRRDFLRNSSFAAVGLSLPFLSKANFLDAAAGFKIQKCWGYKKISSR